MFFLVETNLGLALVIASGGIICLGVGIIVFTYKYLTRKSEESIKYKAKKEKVALN